MMRVARKSGFTLIELLIVIVIIGILAGVVIAVMNPAAQQTKAKQAVLRANVDKICLAMHACAATRITDAATFCSSSNWTNLGVNNPAGTPAASTYAVTTSGTVITASGTLGTCVFGCTYDTSTGTATPVSMTSAAGTCLVE